MTAGEWILVLIAGIAAPFLVAALIGCVLPRKHVATRWVSLRQAPQTLWDAITDFDRLPSWWLLVRAIEKLPKQNGRARFRQVFANRRGKDQAIEIEVVESKEPSQFVTRIANEESPFQGCWTYDIAPAENGARVTVTEVGVIGNPLIRFFFRTMMSKTFHVDSFLRALGQKFGEKVDPQ